MASHKNQKNNKVNPDIEKVKLIRSLISMNKHYDALEKFNSFFGERTNNYFALIEYARILEKIENFNKAIEVCDYILNYFMMKDNDIAYVYYLKADAYFKTENFDLSYENFKKSQEYKPQARTLFRIYGLLIKFERYEEANKLLKDILKYPYNDDNKFVINKARIVESMTNLNRNTKSGYKKAEHILDSVDKKVLLNGEEKGFYFDYLICKANISFSLYHNYTEAEDYLKKALFVYNNENINKNNTSVKTSYIAAKILIGIIKSSEGLYDEGNKIFEEALNTDNLDDNNIVTIYINIAKNYMVQNRADKAIIILEELIKKFPDNVNVHDSYIKSIIQKEIYDKNFELAKKLILENVGKVNVVEDLYFMLINIYLHEGDYKTAKETFIKFTKIHKQNGRKYVNYSRIRKFSAFFNALEGKNINYLSSQIIDFNKDLAVEHIKEHQNRYRSNDVFSSDIDINGLYDYIEDNINEDTYIDTFILDRYFIEYENVGYNSLETMNHIVVCTVPNTKNIITAYPSNRFIYDEDFLAEEYEETQEEYEKPKVRQRLSQVEKFNKKYGLE